MSTVHAPVSVTPVIVYTPAAAGLPSAYFFNEGQGNSYLGGPNVSKYNGFRLGPGQGFSLTGAYATVYACSSYSFGAGSAVTTGAVVAGGTALTLTSGGTAFTTGSYVVIEPGTAREEVLLVSSSNAGTVNTSAFNYGHANGVTFQTAVPQATAVHTESGTV